MLHQPFSSLDELLTPRTLTGLVGSEITSARRMPFVGGHSASGSSFFAVETNDGRGPRLVVKLSSMACDWIMRATADEQGREARVSTSGLIDRLPSEITYPVIACARDGAGWAILMPDISEDLLPDPIGDPPLGADDHWLVLDAMAALHATFWEDPHLADPAFGFCRPWHMFTALSPATGQREAEHPNEVVRWVREGWELFWTLIEPDVTALMQQLLDDPTPLCAALARYPRTLTHGDPRVANLGIRRGPQPRVVLIDWQLVGPGAPGLDLSWYLAQTEGRSPVSHETTIAWYRASLARRLADRFDEQWWQPQWELSLLGQLIRFGWAHGWDYFHWQTPDSREATRASLAWWSEQARAGARWL